MAGALRTGSGIASVTRSASRFAEPPQLVGASPDPLDSVAQSSNLNRVEQGAASRRGFAVPPRRA
jgi:hypothetical protein